MQDLAGRLAGHLSGPSREAGYAGPVGIDALVYRRDGRLRIKPIVEINPRFTMGRVALALSGRMAPGRTGVWLILTEREIRAAGYPGVVEFARRAEQRYPLETVSESGRISGGVLFTTDPGRVRGFLTLLTAGASLEACRARLAELGLRARAGG